MTSKTRQFNIVTGHLGVERVDDWSEESNVAKTIDQVWFPIRNSTLISHWWNFAERLASLAAMAEAPAWRYARKFAIPSGPPPVTPRALRIKEIENKNATWKVFGREILTDEAAPLNIVYTSMEEDETLWPDSFVEANALHVAFTVCSALKQDEAKKAALFKDYLAILREARSADGQEGTLDPWVDSSWLATRLT